MARSRRSLILPGLGIALAAALAACDGRADGAGADAAAGDAAAGEPLPLAVSSPAGAGSSAPNLAVGPDGVYLTWLEPTAGGDHALRFSRRHGGGWSAPATIATRPRMFVNWADFPSLLALDDGTLAAHWLEKSGDATYAYDVRLVVSTDGGSTWSPDVAPHRDGVETEHGFVSLFPVGDRIGAVWLDGRGMASGEPMALRFATLGRDGVPGPEALLDGSTCDCCQTGAALTASGPLVVYRDRTEGEVRDISAVRLVDGAWTAPAPVHEDGWVIAACPVNGPSVAAAGERVAVAWFTGAEGDAPRPAESERDAVRRMGEQGRVLLAFSDDAGVTFGAPVRVDDGGAMGRADVVLLEDGSALVLWLERTAQGAEVRLRRVGDDGAGPSRALARTAAERASGFPRVARDGDRLVFAWTEPGAAGGVRTAETRVSEAVGGLAAR